jgi:dynein heavy chain
MDAVLPYNYEYLGNSSRIVITPLTERCYRTLVMSLHLLYGGAPDGPAGCGKTETVKDLAKHCARLCIVLNCSEAMDHYALGKLFKGLAATGAWACFDGCHRVHIDVMSVMAHHILHIQQALAKKQHEIEFEGTSLPLRATGNVFITTDSSLRQTEFPDNLRVLLRPIAMMECHTGFVAEIRLYAGGFQSARPMAAKITAFYALCSANLSSQPHYEFGLRAVCTVLLRAISLKRSHPQECEETLTLRALWDINVAQFVGVVDTTLFKHICNDLFPRIPCSTRGELVSDQFVRGMEEYYKAHNLQKLQYLEDKTAQLNESMQGRAGCMILGAPNSGKTTSLRLLQSALTSSAAGNATVATSGDAAENVTTVQLVSLNPKAVTRPQLCGYFDPTTNAWVDGILPCWFRSLCRGSDNASEQQKNTRRILHCDGPVLGEKCVFSGVFCFYWECLPTCRAS